MNGFLKKALRYKATHRGLKESDVLLATFVDKYLEALNPDESLCFERFLKESDQDILAWIIRQETPPKEYVWITELMRNQPSYAF